MVFHGFWLVSIVLLVENTTKLILSRPCRPEAGFGLVYKNLAVKNHKAFSYSEEDPSVCSTLSGVRHTTTAFLPIDDGLTACTLAADHHSADEAQCRTFHLW